MPKELFTVGYEGRDIDSFVAVLKNNFINCVLDVRQVPLSHKPFFSKSRLKEKLAQEDIEYVHLKELGSPKLLRESLKSTGDYPTFFEKMNEYLKTQHRAIEQAYEYVQKRTCCLLCFEHFAVSCHRKIVALKIKERDGNGLKINHI